MKAKDIVVDLLVIVIIVISLWSLNRIFINKDVNLYNYINYTRQDDNSIDVLILGSSHSMNAIDARELDLLLSERNIDMKSFNMSITGLRFESMEYRLKEALKTQKPKVLLIETFSSTPMHYSNAEVTRRYAIDYMPLTINKFLYVNEYVEENKISYLFPFLRYHSRWYELTKEDFEILNLKKLYERSKPFGLETETEDVTWEEDDGYFNTDYSKEYETESLDPDAEEALKRILDIAKKNDIKVLFVSIPYKIQMDYGSEHLVKNNNYISQKYVDNKTTFMKDFNRSYLELEWKYDYMQDEGHLNEHGREVLMPLIADYVAECIS